MANAKATSPVANTTRQRLSVPTRARPTAEPRARKPLRNSGAYKPQRPSTPATPTTRPDTAERLELDKIAVHRLPPTSLAAHLSWAAYVVMAVAQGHSMQTALRLMHIDAVARANVQRLSFDAMRHWGMTRFWLTEFIASPPNAWVQALLCVALTQLHLEAEDEFTLVHQAVIAVDNARPQAKGLSNAILRRFLRERADWLARAQHNDVARWNHPQWWIDALRQHYPEQWPELLTANQSHPAMTLRVNRRVTNSADYVQQLAQHNIAAHALAQPLDAVVLTQPMAVTSLPQFTEGAVSVQDAAAQWAAHLLQPQAHERILDACAAPGGKTAHLLELGGVHVTAIEKDAQRATRIHDTLHRLQLSAEVRTIDANRVHEWWDGVPFDKILLDAPCSASGVVRRHPDIRWLRQASDIAELALQQAALLRTLWKVLAIGGQLLYVTCSIFPEEGEAVISEFLQHNRNAQLLPIQLPEQVATPGHAAQLLPSMDVANPHDGFYYALLTKTAEVVC